MIFVTVGSQKFQFNRLLKEIDRLLEENIINEEVFAQTGYSDYKPQNYEYENFIDREKFLSIINMCDKVITHGGTGAIIGAVKQGKKVIAVPRLREYGEHVDDHQLQIISEFEKINFIKSVRKIEDLSGLVNKIGNYEFSKYESNTKIIIESIEKFINI